MNPTTAELDEYFKQFIAPKVTPEFIQQSLLIPYLPENVIEQAYGTEEKEKIKKIFHKSSKNEKSDGLENGQKYDEF